MIKKSAALFVGLSLMSGTIASADERSWFTFFQKGEALSKAGKHAGAISMYQAAVEEAEKLPSTDRLTQTLSKLASEYESAKNLQEANKCLKRALALGKPNSSSRCGPVPVPVTKNSNTEPLKTPDPTSSTKAPGVSKKLDKTATTPSPNAADEIDMGPYMADLQRRLKKHWFPPKASESRVPVVTLRILSDGSITDSRISRSSGSVEADKAALKAVKVAAPVRPLPPGAPSSIDIQFTFDYHVTGGK